MLSACSDTCQEHLMQMGCQHLLTIGPCHARCSATVGVYTFPTTTSECANALRAYAICPKSDTQSKLSSGIASEVSQTGVGIPFLSAKCLNKDCAFVVAVQSSPLRQQHKWLLASLSFRGTSSFSRPKARCLKQKLRNHHIT